MSQINTNTTTGSSGTDSSGQTKHGKDLRDVDIDQFLQLLITQLQNQDPMNPMDNAEMLQQISQIREISSTNQLSDTLGAVSMGQNLSTASSLIGKQVKALNDDAEEVSGVIDRVSVVTGEEGSNERTLRVHIGTNSIDLKNIREIVPS